MKDPRSLILAPVISEKTYDLIDTNSTYTFRVHPTATKTEVAQAIEAIFDVDVINVNTLNRKGKRKRNRRDWTWGQRPRRKHAMVQLAPGQSIPIFEGA